MTTFRDETKARAWAARTGTDVLQNTRASLLDLITADFEFVRGSPQPFGATVIRGGLISRCSRGTPLPLPW
jgi:hypothetical protein